MIHCPSWIAHYVFSMRSNFPPSQQRSAGAQTYIISVSYRRAWSVGYITSQTMLLCVSHSRSPHNVLHLRTDATCSICFSTYRTWLQVELTYLWRKDGWVHLVRRKSVCSHHTNSLDYTPFIYVSHNLAILRLCCAFTEFRDCITHVCSLKIA